MAPLLRWTLATLFTITLAAPAVTASAAPAADPVAWERVDVALHVETEGTILIVSGTLPENAPLPTQVELAVPEGSQYMWAGEILGGPVSEDPEVTYVKDTREGMDVYSFELSSSRLAQIEVNAPEALTFDGTAYAARIDWVAPWDVPAVGLSARIPQGSEIVSPAEGASVAPGPTGYSYYSTELKDVAAGQPTSLAFSYAAPAAGAAGAAAGGAPAADNGVATAIVAIVVLGALVLLGYAVWRKMQLKGLPADDTSIEPAAPRSGAPAHAVQEPIPDAESEPVAPRGPKKTTILGMGIALVLVVAVVMAATSGGSATQVGDTVTMSYAAVDACTSASIPLSTPPGADLAKDAEKILEALRPLEGVGSATVNLSGSFVEVAFCESQASETVIRQLLAATGYVDAAAAAPAPADAEATGAP